SPLPYTTLFRSIHNGSSRAPHPLPAVSASAPCLRPRTQRRSLDSGIGWFRRSCCSLLWRRDVDAHLCRLPVNEIDVLGKLQRRELRAAAQRFHPLAAEALDRLPATPLAEKEFVEIVCRPAAQRLAAAFQKRRVTDAPEITILLVAAS